jgi:hypothetical protein
MSELPTQWLSPSRDTLIFSSIMNYKQPTLLRNAVVAIALFLSAPAGLSAEGTRTWTQSRADEFTKGTSHGVAISSAGFLALAPAFKLLATTPASAVWATVVGPDGAIYAATGGPARVYRVESDGKANPIFQPQELQVQALLVDKHGVIYAATNPDGKVYKIERGGAKTPAKDAKTATVGDWTSTVYFDPGTKYIWSLALDGSGNLYVATGDHGQVFKVAPNGEHSVFFKSDEPHIRVLALDGRGNLIAGSDGSGLIYRITPQGEGFVLYSTPKREITSLVIDPEGIIYAAAAGEKHGGGASPSVTIVVPGGNQGPGGPPGGGPGGQGSEAPVAINSTSPAVPGGSEVYKLAPEGTPLRIWGSRDDLVYSLAWDAQGKLLAGTGNRGQIYEIDGRDTYVELLQAGADQVTALTKTPDGGLFVSTSNLGKIFLLHDVPENEGSYESDVFDAQIFSKWGRAEFRGQGNVELFARSGNVDNPDRNWSTWKRIDLEKSGAVTAPPARFIQWKAILHPGNPAPRVDAVSLNYLTRNVAPEFDEVNVAVGTRYSTPPRPPNLEPGQRFDPQPNPIHDSDSIGVKWNVHDANDDQMVYSVYYRGDGQRRWLLLKSGLSERFYSFDASLLPDGGYVIKVVASDAPSHSPQEALSSERESDHFDVDTTPPQIEDLRASVEGNAIHVQFRALDSFSPIRRAEYSLDAGDWHFLEPVGQISDSKTESYDFSLPIAADGAGHEHVVVVRAYDRFDNMNSAKVVVAAGK